MPQRALGDVWRRIDHYAREIVPSFNAYIYYRVGYAVARAAARALYRVRIGFVDEAAWPASIRKSTIVFVMNHRSNMDYVLVAFLAAERAALSFRRRRVGAHLAAAAIDPRHGRLLSSGAIPATRSTAPCCSATCRWPPRPASPRRCFPRAG
jgi:hypothetical protein